MTPSTRYVVSMIVTTQESFVTHADPPICTTEKQGRAQNIIFVHSRPCDRQHPTPLLLE